MLLRLLASCLPLLMTACMSLPGPEVDRRIGAASARTVEEAIGLIDDQALDQYLERVGQRVASALPAEDLADRSRRSQGALALPMLAAMNGLAAGARFGSGERIRVAVRAPHLAAR